MSSVVAFLCLVVLSLANTTSQLNFYIRLLGICFKIKTRLAFLKYFPVSNCNVKRYTGTLVSTYECVNLVTLTNFTFLRVRL